MFGALTRGSTRIRARTYFRCGGETRSIKSARILDIALPHRVSIPEISSAASERWIKICPSHKSKREIP